MKNVQYVHTNIVAKDWRRLAQFYMDVFGCKPKLPERDLKGVWLDTLTSLEGAHIRGIHLLLPGVSEKGPTLEIFQYSNHIDNSGKEINTEGFGHIAFAVEDVEKCLQEVLRNGGSTVGSTVKGNIPGVGEIHVVYARDPEGNIVEIQKWT